MKKEKKDKGIFIRLSSEQMEKLQKIKQKHFFNVSAYFRQMIDNLYEKFEFKHE